MSRRGVLALLALAELLGMSVWFSASALAPQLREAWSLSAAQAGWLTTAVQLGFVAGTASAVALVWGFAVVADSAQFSALVTELAPPHAVGTALTIQTSLGFLLTMASIQLVPRLVDGIGWRWAFVMLAAGPALGILAMRRLQRVRRARTPA